MLIGSSGTTTTTSRSSTTAGMAPFKMNGTAATTTANRNQRSCRRWRLPARRYRMITDASEPPRATRPNGTAKSIRFRRKGCQAGMVIGLVNSG